MRNTSIAVVLTVLAVTLTAIPTPAFAQLAYARVLADGTVNNDSGNITVVKIGAGFYCIGVTGGTVQVPVASLDSLFNVGGTVQTGVFWASGCPPEANNIAVITRPQAQDGGLPGQDRAFYIIVAGTPNSASDSRQQDPAGMTGVRPVEGTATTR
jgi:hypothetical protein